MHFSVVIISLFLCIIAYAQPPDRLVINLSSGEINFSERIYLIIHCGENVKCKSYKGSSSNQKSRNSVDVYDLYNAEDIRLPVRFQLTETSWNAGVCSERGYLNYYIVGTNKADIRTFEFDYNLGNHKYKCVGFNSNTIKGVWEQGVLQVSYK